MRSNYKKLGQFIRVVDVRNKENRKDNLLGVSTRKVFIDSVANTVGTDFKKYKIVKRHQFTYVPDTSRRGDKMGVAMLESQDQALISQAYTVFEVTDTEKLVPEYLMMWFRRSEFDRYARFKSHGSVREIFDWDEMCELEFPVPSIEKQREIVREYNVVNDRIALNEKLIKKLEDTAQAIYKQWFIDFEFPISKEYAVSTGKPELEGKPYKTSGCEFEYSKELERNIPIVWGAIDIKGFVKSMKSGGTPTRDIVEYWNSKDVPWLKTGEIANCVITDAEEYISTLGLKESSAKIFAKDTVLMAMYGDGKTKGQVGFLRIEAATNQACCSMQCNDINDASFLFYYLRFNYQEIVRSAIGGAQANLSKGLIEKIKILNVTKETIDVLPFNCLINKSEVLVRENNLLKRLREVILQRMTKV
jgi:type I restriction enzyme S subunit